MAIEVIAIDTATNQCGRVPLSTPTTVTASATNTTGKTIGTITVGSTVTEIKETVTALAVSGGTVTYTNESGSASTFTICDLLKSLPAL